MTHKDKLLARSRWYAAYEAELTRWVPTLAGKVDWDTAAFLFNRGDDSRAAAYLMARRWAEHDDEA